MRVSHARGAHPEVLPAIGLIEKRQAGSVSLKIGNMLIPTRLRISATTGSGDVHPAQRLGVHRRQGLALRLFGGSGLVCSASHSHGTTPDRKYRAVSS